VTPLRLVMMSSVLGAVAIWLIASGWVQERPALDRVRTHLARREDQQRDRVAMGSSAWFEQSIGGTVVRAVDGRASLSLDAADLRLIGRSPERHGAVLGFSFLVALVVPLVLFSLGRALGLLPLSAALPMMLALAAAVLAPLVVHSDATERSRRLRNDLRHQLSAYLDVVTMLLAGNTGHEGALEQAAHAGDGRLFVELRRRMRESSTGGRSLVHALSSVGTELGLVELEQVAATTSLSALEGAPVVRTLAAKCATLRSTLATEQETEARLRTSRLTAPLVGMALIFMALVIYPALNFS
jgi:tight adherence protein C